MMEQLVKYGSDDEISNNNPPNSEVPANNTEQYGNLESEWENFEKMLAGGDDDCASNPADTNTVSTAVTDAVDEKPAVVEKPVVANILESSTSNASNPYAYLAKFTDNQTHVGGAFSATHEEMEKQLEEFLEKTAQAASVQTSSQDMDIEKGHTDSDHSDSDSDSHSGHSSHSKSPSPSSDKNTTEKKPTTDTTDTKESRAAALKRLEEMNPDKSGPSVSRRRSGSHSKPTKSHRSRSRSRSRSRRSRSRRSNSRSRSRRHRRRSGSRSKHRRHRRRSGSRHRRRPRRSRSPRHRRDRNKDSGRRNRRRRSHRRSNSRERRQELKKAQYGAVMQQQQAAQSSKTEDFKAKMKRELHQAARDAMAGKGQATPQQALLQTMAAMHAKAQELTGVEVPKFYNPAAINPLKFAEQQQKRKLLWSKAGENKEHSLQKFQGTDVVADEKYRKLMGIKGEVEVSEMSEEQKRKQNELFHQLDQEYAFARITTHTHRGMGLGVVSSMAAQSANEQFNKP